MKADVVKVMIEHTIKEPVSAVIVDYNAGRLLSDAVGAALS
jgi:hypothetical protein